MNESESTGPDDRSGMAEDLETIRAVAAAAAASAEREAALARRVAELEAEREATLDLAEAEFARQLGHLQAQLASATRPITVTQEGLSGLSDAEVLELMRSRSKAAAGILERARYKGVSGEIWDLVRVFTVRGADPVLASAARSLLGQEKL